MKEKELRSHAVCSKCKNKIGHTGVPLFWTIKIDRHGLNVGALRRNAGLVEMMGGSTELARAMGPDEEMTLPVMETKELTLCEECAMPIMKLLEQCK